MSAVTKLNGAEEDIEIKTEKISGRSSINPKIRWEEIILSVRVGGKLVTTRSIDYRELR